MAKMDQESETNSLGIVERWQQLPNSEKVHYTLLGAFLFLNAADALSTFMFLQYPNTFERNRFMSNMLETYGPATVLAIKTSAALIPLAMVEGGRLMMRALQANELVVRASSDIPLVLANVAFATLVVNNILVIRQATGG